MKTFQLPAQTQAKLVKVTPHKEFDGKNPLKQAISLKLRARLSLATLRQFSPHAPDIFVRVKDDAGQQESVEGVAPVVLELVDKDVSLPIAFANEFTGYTVTIDRALGDIELYGCKVSKIKVDEVKPDGEHGTAEIEWSLGSDVKITPELVGVLCAMEAGDVWLGQVPPDKPVDEAAAAKAHKKQRDAEKAGQQRLDAAAGDKASDDDLAAKAKALVISTQVATISSLQKELTVGAPKAAKVMEMLERAGVVSPMNEHGQRQVLVKDGATAAFVASAADADQAAAGDAADPASTAADEFAAGATKAVARAGLKPKGAPRGRAARAAG